MTPRPGGAPVVDAHHHLWTYDREHYSWIDESMAELRRDFSADDLAAAAGDAGVDATVVVQARQSLEETRTLLRLARRSPLIRGVVGWLPLADAPALAAALEEFQEEPLLKGARHVVQSEAEGFLDDPLFGAGVGALTRLGLSYDLLVRAGQLPAAMRFVDRHPRELFILDHAAKPAIAAGRLEPWRTHLRELASRPHVVCKLSGMVTEAAWASWSPETVRPYLDVAVAAFGPDRLLAGSDWPVCLVASAYRRWWQTLQNYFAGFSQDERDAVFGTNACRVYQLSL